MHAAVPFTVTDKRMTLNANVSLGPFSTAQQLSSALNRNELSAEELLMATVERIEAVLRRRCSRCCGPHADHISRKTSKWQPCEDPWEQSKPSASLSQ
jgi:hypothetical protein